MDQLKQHAFTRREACKASIAAAGLAALHRTVGRGSVFAAKQPKLADSREAFESAFGAGKDTDTGLVQFRTPTDQEPVYNVLFASSGAEFIEADFSKYADGGRTEENAEIGYSQFLYDDAQQVYALRVGGFSLSRSHYVVTTHYSSSLAQRTGRSGNTLVLDESVSAASAGMNRVYARGSVMMETYDIRPIKPGDGVAAVGTTLEGWQTRYGPGEASQTGHIIEVPEVGRVLLGLPDSTVTEVDLVTESPITIAKAVSFAGACLPPDSALQQTFWAPGTPSGPVGIRTQIWYSEAAGGPIAVLIYVDGNEENGTSSRVLVSANAEYFNSAPDVAASTESPTTTQTTPSGSSSFAARQYVDPGTDSSTTSRILNAVIYEAPDEAAAKAYIQDEYFPQVRQTGIEAQPLEGFGDETYRYDDTLLHEWGMTGGSLITRAGAIIFGCVYIDTTAQPVGTIMEDLVAYLMAGTPSSDPVNLVTDGTSTGGWFAVFPPPGDPVVLGLVPAFDTDDINEDGF